MDKALPVVLDHRVGRRDCKLIVEVYQLAVVYLLQELLKLLGTLSF